MHASVPSMRIIFSRKGFDSAAGGGPSPIIEGRPVSLPIPASAFSRTTYGDLEMAEAASRSSKGRYGGQDWCHHDPMFLADGRCALGQCGAAQTHLERQRVGAGDVFLFFGLFRDFDAQGREGKPHHRIFGYLRIAEVIALRGGAPQWLVELNHPHALGMHGSNDAVYCGPGRVAQRASEALRLTVPEGPPSVWKRPAWLRQGGLTYHDRPARWMRGGVLQSVARGQEFVADIGTRKAPRKWLDHIISEIER